jgi:squalene-associated FAD-dependent desaturase
MIYVIGAGLSGLSAAVGLAANGVPVQVVEAAPTAGGRCRSYYDSQLGITVDNGNHLILSGNSSTRKYLSTIGAEHNFIGPAEAEYAFHEIPSGKSWKVRPNNGLIPWWIFDRSRRVPDTHGRDYLSFVPLIGSGSRTSAELRRRDSVLWRRMLRPVLLATLNSEPEEAAPQLIAVILLGTLGRGGKACRPRIASPTLSAAFVDPAVRFIESNGGAVHFGKRLLRIGFENGQIRELEFLERKQAVLPGDAVILAVPAWTAKSLVPGIAAPTDHRAIVSTHFALPPPAGAPVITGIIGGTAEWIFCFPDRISVTISNADRLLDQDRNEIATLCWQDVVQSLGVKHDMPSWQVIKERRATFAATPEQEKKRSGPVTSWPNLFVAGDWTSTGLPATIEGAIRSGRHAGRLARRYHAA